MRQHQNFFTRHSPLALVALSACSIILGIGVGYAIPRSTPSSEATRLGGYNFINPLLACDIQEDVAYPGFGQLQKAFDKQINDAKSRGYITRASVYFRDMNRSYWTGVDQNNLYIPASLLKVPILVAYLHESEADPTVLKAQYAIPFGADENAGEYFKPAKPLARGVSYSVDELLRAMIEQSDNNAANTLYSHVSTSSMDDVYESFGVPVAPDSTTESISPAEYMLVFRILYNATYLNRSDSQKALELLSAIDFPQGAVRGIPQDMPFANKFGERTTTTVNSSGATVSQKRELADCGIVYYPRHPYGICIMTEGTDFSKLSDLIAELSHTAYTAVNGGLLND